MKMEKTYFIETKEQHIAICTAWKKFVNEGGTMNGSHMLLYNILRSRPYDKGFTPITKPVKLQNGMNPWTGFRDAAWRIRAAAVYGSGLEALLKPFGETINKEVIDRAWAAIKDDQRLK